MQLSRPAADSIHSQIPRTPTGLVDALDPMKNTHESHLAGARGCYRTQHSSSWRAYTVARGWEEMLKEAPACIGENIHSVLFHTLPKLQNAPLLIITSTVPCILVFPPPTSAYVHRRRTPAPLATAFCKTDAQTLLSATVSNEGTPSSQKRSTSASAQPWWRAHSFVPSAPCRTRLDALCLTHFA